MELIKGSRPFALFAEADTGRFKGFNDPADFVGLVDLEADVVGEFALRETGQCTVLGFGAEDLCRVPG